MLLRGVVLLRTERREPVTGTCVASSGIGLRGLGLRTIIGTLRKIIGVRRLLPTRGEIASSGIGLRGLGLRAIIGALRTIIGVRRLLITRGEQHGVTTTVGVGDRLL